MESRKEERRGILSTPLKTAMEKALHCLILLSLTIPSRSKSTTSITRFQSSVSIAKITNRRILHQPLFPMSFTPPPLPPPDNPFFPQIIPPSQPDPDQQNISLSPTNSINPVLPTSPKSNPMKKIAIAGSVSIATLFFVLALALLVYRFRERCILESVKLGGSDSERLPSATSYILYLGTTRPSNRAGGDLNRSPYHRVNRVHGEEVLHPSPEIQPMPPLMGGNRQIVPSVLPSDEETPFYSPQESIVQNTESSYYAATQQSLPKTTSTTATRSVISCFNGSTFCKPSLETKNSNSSTALPSSLPLPPLSQLSCLQQPHLQFALTKMMSPLTKNSIVSSPASSDRNSVLSCSKNNSPPLEEKSSSMPPMHPPPPPPPPLPALLGKIRPPTTNAFPMTIQPSSRLQSQVPAPANASRDEALVPVVEGNHGGSSLEPLKREEDSNSTKPRLKPLHWDKVRASSDCTMVWDQLKTGSFQLNEDMIQTLFVSSTSTNPLQKEANRNSALPRVGKENRVLDVKRSQNIAIILRALNVTLEEVSEALLDASSTFSRAKAYPTDFDTDIRNCPGNPEGLDTEILEALVKMAPTKEEEVKLKDYNGEISKLGSAERFLKAVLDIPFAFERVDAMLYRDNFDTDVKYLSNSFEILEAACKELKNSRLFLKLLEAVLRTGNRMNVGTNHGEAKAFRLDSLLKLVDIKGTDGKTTLLHFVVQEIIRSEALDSDIPNQMQYADKKKGLQVVAALSTELGNVKKAAGMDPSVLGSYLSKLITGLEKIKLTLEEKSSMQQEKFFESMHLFIKESEDEIVQIKAKEKTAFSHVREIGEYFHGDRANEEDHPFRIFMIVRDFLFVLDQVCKDVHERTIVGSVRTFRIPVGASSLPVFNRLNTRQDRTSSDEDSSSSF